MRMAFGGIIGGVLGLGIWYLGRCTSGACPFTSNPIITVSMGALIGVMLSAKR